MKPFMLRLPADGTCRKERVFTDKERSTISDAFMRNGASFPLPHSILKRAASITMQRKQRSRGHFMIMRIIPFYSWIIRRLEKPFSIWSCPWHSYPSSSTMDLFHISYRSYASCIMYCLFVIRRAYFPIEANYSNRRICSYPYSFL